MEAHSQGVFIPKTIKNLDLMTYKLNAHETKLWIQTILGGKDIAKYSWFTLFQLVTALAFRKVNILVWSVETIKLLLLPTKYNLNIFLVKVEHDLKASIYYLHFQDSINSGQFAGYLVEGSNPLCWMSVLIVLLTCCSLCNVVINNLSTTNYTLTHHSHHAKINSW